MFEYQSENRLEIHEPKKHIRKSFNVKINEAVATERISTERGIRHCFDSISQNRLRKR